MNLSLAIPTYNERENVRTLLRELVSLLEPVRAGAYELIVVDDDSPDQTAEVVADLSRNLPQIKLLKRIGERGLATAVVHGWQAANTDILGVIDADLQHPPEIILQLLNAIENGADLAVASRHVKGGGVSDWNILRRMVSRGAQLIGLCLAPKVVGRLSDPMSGYFLLRRSAIDLNALEPVGYKILLEVLARGTFKRIEEVGYVFRERQKGGSKLSWRQYLEYLQHLWRLRRKK